MNELYKSEGASKPVPALATAARWDDAMLVGRALDGDPFAENAIYRQHAPYLLNLATRLLGRMSDADDAVQETFITAFQKLEQLSDPSALRPWLIRIMISKVRKSFRLRRIKILFSVDNGRDDATLTLLALHDARPDLRAELKEIDDGLQRAPAEWRTSWMLHRVEGMSIHETSRAVGRSVATVKRYVNAVDVSIQARRGAP